MPKSRAFRAGTWALTGEVKRDGHPNPIYVADGDWINPVWNTMFTFQGDTSMTTDDAIDQLKSEYDGSFG